MSNNRRESGRQSSKEENRQVRDGEKKIKKVL